MSTSATSASPRRPLRSVGAVLAGLVVNIALAGAIDAALYATGIYPPRPQPMTAHLWALALSYRVVVAVIGGFVTARLSPAWPIRHSFVLGAIGTALGVPFVLANWDKPEFGPHWFALSVASTALPCAALGGVLQSKRAARTHQ